ncbi:Retrovirus-related Pol polyprotein from transposon TNT 1-94 [Gossypium australe]|uniref:Retrovirus-related Pol polyprotein from transposon TNT 1-94 n=1 Tax=Gossypium australe TaxID=47621 RepID=A0A5B6VLL2_9ROSI|nr:Retrovirus-related Pol polyprotein from transposon TNT 1-94 [Gossypium australe]
MRAEKPLELAHTNVCDPVIISTRGGYEYYCIYLMHRKRETFDKFKEFHAKVEKRIGLPIRHFSLVDVRNIYLVSS